uniref:Adenylate kinase n=1 Tax=Oxytricha trifallax TaxID=94289 RepID=A7Y479_OXYTR|nr:adenylate kinase [Sterkiella histriomuscorum]
MYSQMNQLKGIFAVDIGVPVVDMNTILQNVVEQAGKNEEFSHSFFLRVRDMIQAEDADALAKEKVYTKLLRLSAQASHGFVLTNFPNNSGQAEELESFKGGLNAFVHVSLPDDILVDIEENKLSCKDCGRFYYPEEIIDQEQGVHIESFIPEDGNCHDCGSSNISEGSDPISFERELNSYKSNKDELLGFYDHYGLLVDYELKKGFQDFDKLKKKIQYGIKH